MSTLKFSRFDAVPWRAVVFGLLIVFTGAVVRFHLLGAQSLWNDEGSAYVQATRSLTEIAENAARDIHPPGYYWLLAVWRALVGESEFGLRSLSALAGMITVALTFALGRRLYGTGAGVVAALIVALNTFNIYYSQEARMYALLGMWAAAGMWAFAGLIRSHAPDTQRWALVLALVNAAGLWTHYVYPAMMLVQGALFVVWLVAALVAAIRPHPLTPSPFGEGGQMAGSASQSSFGEGGQMAGSASQSSFGEGRQMTGSASQSSFGEGRQMTGSASQPSFGDGGQMAGSASQSSFGEGRQMTGSASQPSFGEGEQIAAPVPQPSFGEGKSSRSRMSQVLFLYILANLATITLYAAWIPTAWGQLTTWPNTGAAIPAGEGASIILGWFSLGMTYPFSQLTVAFAFFALFGLLSFPREDGRLTWWRILVSVVWALALPAAFLAFGFFREANLKFLLPSQIGFALWVGRGAWVLWYLEPRYVPRSSFIVLQYIPKAAAALGTLALILALLSGLTPLYTANEFHRDDYRGIVERISADSSPSKAVILNAPGQSEVFNYYYDDDAPVYLLPIGMTVDEDATRQTVRDIIAGHEKIYAVLWGTDERDPNGIVEGTLDREAYEIESTWYGSVRLVRYVTPQTLEATQESGAVFGDAIRLEGYALNSDRLRGDDVLLVQLVWTAQDAIETNYKVSVQILNPDGTLALQRDADPAGGQRPTSTWGVGERIEDNHALVLPADMTAGVYTLNVSLYEPVEPYTRLSVGDGDALTLAVLDIEAR